MVEPGAETIFFLSDYGLRDEFVGVVHAVLRRLAPAASVIDLTHQVPAFDVRAGAAALVRVVPHLGPGLVLAVVDPGVGSGRHGLVLEVPEGAGPRWFVGPDNGLLIPAAELAGGVKRAVSLGRSDHGAATFDGRDLFAPAAAALCNGTDPATLGSSIPPPELVRAPEPVVEIGISMGGRRMVRTEVTWVDRFGNIQLAAAGDLVPPSVPELVVSVAGQEVRIRRVHTFADLGAEEPGLLVDGNGCLALVVREGSAAARLGIGAGDLVELVW